MTKLIDIHTHWCLFGREPEKVMAELEWLEAKGYEKLAIYPLAGLGASPEKVLDMIPRAYLELTGITIEETVNDDLESWLAFEKSWRSKPRTLELLSFLDIRAWDGKADLTPWWGEGHAGLKGILIAEEDSAKMGMEPLRKINDLTREGYMDAQRALIELASSHDFPLVYHVDLSLHLGFVEECLTAHPELKINIPHLGFSRRQMAELFEKYPNVMSDISNLGPHMEKNPVSYREFIQRFPDRIMLGSDAIASYDMREAFKYVGWVKMLELPEAVEALLLRENAMRFLG